jgi:hypothetical protein
MGNCFYIPSKLVKVMTTYTALSVLLYTACISYCFYWLGWDSGFKVGKQRGWVNGYASAKAAKRVVQDEVFDYEKN